MPFHPATDLVELLLVPKERVVAPVLPFPVLGHEVVPPLLAVAPGMDGLAGGHVGSPELVGHGIPDLEEKLRTQKKSSISRLASVHKGVGRIGFAMTTVSPDLVDLMNVSACVQPSG